MEAYKPNTNTLLKYFGNSQRHIMRIAIIDITLTHKNLLVVVTNVDTIIMTKRDVRITFFVMAFFFKKSVSVAVKIDSRTKKILNAIIKEFSLTFCFSIKYTKRKKSQD